ncbi:MAG: hypothetical protein K0S07_1556 [Chlamydiales bacterium]|jgi:threonylcarbamoyladenosine tRNA methylthiotransferase MtaB|nr:hypothetical protein [Chlamydiales bacterium]
MEQAADLQQDPEQDLDKKYRVVSLGCRTNQYEAQAYQDQLIGLGFQQAQEGERASLCIVNTCTVTEMADKSSRYEVRRLARENPKAKIVVTGCSAEKNRDALLNIQGVSAVVPNKEKENLLSLIYPEEEMPEFAIKQFDGHTRAFIKVQDGCNSFCTYCIIPYVRGRSRSRPLSAIISEVEALVSAGYREVVLTGINIGDFDGGKKKGETPDRLADLVRAVDAVEGLKRLRISSIDPDEVDDDLIEAVLNGKTTAPSMHIVLQSGSNAILKRMNRKYTKQLFFDTIQRLKSALPHFTCTTDVIVGFPGETEQDFQETLEAIHEVQFAKVHMFPYSKREGTKAATYLNQVPDPVIMERKSRLLRAAEECAFALREKFVGQQMTVLVENKESEGHSFGHTENFLPVRLIGTSLAPGQLATVQLTSNTPLGLEGKVLSSL